MYKHSVLFTIRNPFHKEGGFFSTLLQVSVTDNSFSYTVKDSDERKLFPRWKLEIRFGRGAGVVWGRTLYLACNLFYPTAAVYPSVSDKWWEHIAFGARGRDYCTPKRWQVGFTNNANKVPYVDGV